MPSLVQSNCDAHDTIANGQYGAVWSMGHTQQVCVRIVLLPSNVWQQFFGRSAFLRQQETDLPPAELCGSGAEWSWSRNRVQNLESLRNPQSRGADAFKICRGLSLQEALDLLLNLPSESSDALTDDSSDEEVPVNNILELSSDSEKDQQIEQYPGCSDSCS
ncbi:hypothetical protein TNCV_3962981 [Trichonephila clavipes]|nr:hypothetical protein TNCV_3962981 [Trichonephila clavipes]